MVDLSNEEASIWRELKHGSLGTVLWALRRDRQAVMEFARAVESIDSAKDFGAAIRRPTVTAANALGQLALHQLAADAATTPHIEPRDCRWSIFRVLPQDAVAEICVSISQHRKFIEQARQALADAVEQIKRPAPGGSVMVEENPALAELHRRFLILFGMGLAQILVNLDRSFVALVGEVALLNGAMDSPLYAFSRSTHGADGDEQSE